MDTERRSAGGEQWGPGARVAMAAGTFVSVVSLCLFIHAISQLASASFIAAGIVGRRRATTSLGTTIALATLAGGIVGAVASLVLAATGR